MDSRTNYFIHTTAVIDQGTQIGEGTRVWHFSHLMGGCVVGKGCILGQNVFIGTGVEIGDGVKIQNNVSIYEGVVCEDNVFIGPSVVFTNVINPRAWIERKDEFRQTRIGYGASVGANATIVCGYNVGNYAFVGAGAVVTRDVPAHALVVGNPARVTGWVSRRGDKLVFDSDGIALCPSSGERYQLDEENGTEHCYLLCDSE